MSLLAEDVVRLMDFPRENATAGLLRGQAVLDSLLSSVGAPPIASTFSCSPYRTIAMGCCLLLTGATLVLGCRYPRQRWWLGTAASLILAVVFATGGFDALLPRLPQQSLLVDVAPTGTVENTIMLSAHYDTKTELLDHVGRSILLIALLLSLPLAIWGMRRGRRPAWRWLLTAPAVVLSILAAIQGLSGIAAPHRSHGIRDNAMACALLVEFADRAVRRPLAHTRLQFAWWAGEEVGAQGSRHWANLHLGSLPDLLLNFEAIGAGDQVALSQVELTGRNLHRTDATLRRQLDAAAGSRLRRIAAPLFTDAGPFLDLGVPGLTILNLPGDSRVLRGLHGHKVNLPGIFPNGVEASRILLFEFLRNLDATATRNGSTSG